MENHAPRESLCNDSVIPLLLLITLVGTNLGDDEIPIIKGSIMELHEHFILS